MSSVEMANTWTAAKWGFASVYLHNSDPELASGLSTEAVRCADCSAAPAVDLRWQCPQHK